MLQCRVEKGSFPESGMCLYSAAPGTTPRLGIHWGLEILLCLHYHPHTKSWPSSKSGFSLIVAEPIRLFRAGACPEDLTAQSSLGL